MPTHTLTIDLFHPCRLNELLRLHWAARNRRKKADYRMVAGYALKARLPKAEGKRRVSLVVGLAKGGKRGDEDNWKKCVLDSLVACGQLVNDSFDWCEWGGVSFTRGRVYTRIILEDVP